ncbi:MAG TPA: hypothetical protein VKV80_04720 [Streptosporangiaceae bacterium]|nr:hypothetical protein [Streptosporangiaceae bacterium]
MVAAAAVLASVSGETALALIIAAVAMGFVAYAFVIFTREFNSAGSVYGLTGVVLSFSSFSGFEAAATGLRQQPRWVRRPGSQGY